MTQSTRETQVRQQVGRLEALLQELSASADSAAQNKTREIVQTLMDFHAQGLEKILERIFDSGEVGQEIISSFGKDPLVGNLLLFYGLHPISMEDRVRQALDSVRPYLKSHGGNVELLGIEDGVVHLEMQGSCHGCPSSAMTLKTAIEEAIQEKAPDVTGISVKGVNDHPSHDDSNGNGHGRFALPVVQA